MGQGSLAHTSKTIGQIGGGANTQNSRSRKAKSHNAAGRRSAHARRGPGIGESSGTEEDGGAGERAQSKDSSTSERQRYWNRLAEKQRQGGMEAREDYLQNPRLVVKSKNSNSMLQLGVNYRPTRVVDQGAQNKRSLSRREPSLSERQLDHEDIRIVGDGDPIGEKNEGEVNLVREQFRGEEFVETQRKNRVRSRSRRGMSNSGTQTLKSQCSRCSAHSAEMNVLND